MASNDVVFGKALLKDFPFDPEWRNLNHGSFGSIPKVIQNHLRTYQSSSERRPDPFIRYEYPHLLDASRHALAHLVNAPPDTVVFVSNATVGVNSVFRNLAWNEDGKDVIISFSTIYEGCGKTIDWVVDYFHGRVSNREIPITYPIEDEEIVQKFRDAVKEIESEGKRARIAIFDVVSSRPGVVFPWGSLTKACKDLGVLSMVDGAQGVGMVPLDLTRADPDFFVSNCHKWLHTPRGSALFYVPLRNQGLINTLAISHGYVPKTSVRTTPLPPSSKSAFVKSFEFVGTLDNSPYLCVKDAIQWRREVLGGDERILKYLWELNKKGSALVAEKLGTFVLENKAGTLTNCGMANVALPIWDGEAGATAKEGDVVLKAEESQVAFQWMLTTLMEDYKTFLALFIHGGRFFARISAQVYLDLEDYKWAGETLAEVCARVQRREYLAKNEAE